jgi:integrase
MNVSVTYRLVGVRWHVRFRTRGRREIVRSYPKELVTEREVKREVATFQRRISIEGWDPWAGTASPDESISVQQAIDAWIEHLTSGGSPEQNTKNYRSQVTTTARLGRFLELPLQLVTPEMWNKAVGGGGASPTHQSNRATSVRRLAQWAQGAGYIGKDLSEAVCAGIAFRRRERRVSQHLSKAQVEQVQGALDPDMSDFVQTLYLTGMRAGEALAMRPAWIDLKAGWITVGDRAFRPKSGKNRSVPIPDDLVAILQARMGSERIFGELTYDVSRRRFRVGLTKAMGKDGAGYSLHSLRHTYAINLIMSGFELYEIIQYTGHHSVTMLEANYADWIVRRRPDSFRERFKLL